MVLRTISSIKNLLVREQHEIISAAAMLMVLGLATKITGMFFLTLFTKEFGANEQTDLFYLASIIPETITNVILLGAISGSIIPIFIKIKEEKGDAMFMRSFSSTFNISMLAFIFLSILAAVLSKQLIPFAIKLTQSENIPTPEQTEQVIFMMRVLLIPQILLAVSAFISTALNIYHRFIIPQLAPLFFNLGRILGILILVPLIGKTIWVVIWGMVLGSILHLLVQVPLLRHLNVNIKVGFIDWYDSHFKQVLKLGIPRVLSLSAEQFASIVDSLIAFGLTTASLSAYQLAVRLISFPLSLLGTSYAIASFPTLSKLYAKGAYVEFSTLVHKIINQIFFLAVPVAVILLVLRVPVVRLVYGILGGSFDWNDTLQVAWVIMFFSLGLAFEVMRSALFRIYYSAHNSVVPLISSVGVVFLGVLTGIAFTNYLSHYDYFSLRNLTFNPQYFFERAGGQAGVGGLALSASFVFTLEFIYLIWVMNRKKIIGDIRPLVKELAKKLLAGLIMAIISYAMAKLWDQILNTAKTIPLFILTSTTMIFSFMAYLWTSFVLDIAEVELFINFIIRKAKKLFKMV